MTKELDFLKKQGLTKIKAFYEDGGNSMRIYMFVKKKFGSNQRFHVEKHAQRVLCNRSCGLKENDGPIKCGVINPKPEKTGESARIDSKMNLSATYWEALCGRIPCHPEKGD